MRIGGILGKTTGNEEGGSNVNTIKQINQQIGELVKLERLGSG